MVTPIVFNSRRQPPVTPDETVEAAKKLAFGGMQLGTEKNKQIESILALSISVGHSEYDSPKIVLKEACNLTGSTTGLVVPHGL